MNRTADSSFAHSALRLVTVATGCAAVFLASVATFPLW